MALVTKEFKLDLAPGKLRPVVNASQGDIGRPFMARCYWDGATWTATGYTANIRGRKPDGTVFDYTATVDGSTVTFETTEQMTIISGPVECELVFSNDGDIIASANFVLMVEESPYDPDALSESVIPGIADIIEETIGGDVRDEVQAELEAHPEWTTTVQDGAITKPKIAAAFLPEIENAYVTPEQFGAIGDGVADDTIAIQKAIDTGYNVIFNNNYKISNRINIAGPKQALFGGAVVSTTPEVLYFSGEDCHVSNMSLTTVYDYNAEENVGEITEDENGFTALSALISGNACHRLKITNCVVNGSYTGIYIRNAKGVYICDCDIGSARHICLCLSTSQFIITGNTIHDIDNSFPQNYTNYLIQASDTGTNQEKSIISNNRICNNNSWAGFMSHKWSNLVIDGNIFENVRTAVDVSTVSSMTGLYKNIIISNNIMVGTETDNIGTNRQNSAITFATSTVNYEDVNICGNIIKGFCRFPSSSYGAVNIVNASNVIICGNNITTPNGGSAYESAIDVRGNVNNIIITENNLLTPNHNAIYLIESNNTAPIVNNMTIKNNNFSDTLLSAVIMTDGTTISRLSFDNAVPEQANNVRVGAGTTINGVTYATTVYSLFVNNSSGLSYKATWTGTLAGNTAERFNIDMPGIRDDDVILATVSGGTGRQIMATACRGAYNICSILIYNALSTSFTGTITIYLMRYTKK